MSIEARLTEELKAAMRAKDTDRLACIRQVKAKLQEAINAPGFTGEVDDALCQGVITAYVKQLRRAVEELGDAERATDLKAKYSAECAYLEQYLPQLLGPDETREIVRSVIDDLGVTDAKQSGRIIGAVMKGHKGRVDPAVVRTLVEEALTQGEGGSPTT